MTEAKEILEIIFQEKILYTFLLIIMGGGFLYLLNTRGIHKGSKKDDDDFKIDLF